MKHLNKFNSVNEELGSVRSISNFLSTYFGKLSAPNKFSFPRSKEDREWGKESRRLSREVSDIMQNCLTSQILQDYKEDLLNKNFMSIPSSVRHILMDSPLGAGKNYLSIFRSGDKYIIQREYDRINKFNQRVEKISDNKFKFVEYNRVIDRSNSDIDDEDWNRLEESFLQYFTIEKTENTFIMEYRELGENKQTEIFILPLMENIFHLTQKYFADRRVNESLPRQHSVDQFKKLRKMTKGTDIGDRVSNMEKQGANIQYSRNVVDAGIESYEDFEKHNKKFIPSWNLKHLISPFTGEGKSKKKK